MDDQEYFSRRTMLIGLRVCSLLFLIGGCIFAASSAAVRMDWAAGAYGAAIGIFSGRLLFWLVLAIYAWIHSGRYRKDGH